MKNKKYSLKRIIFLLSVVMLSGVFFQAQAQGDQVAPGQFPFFRSFLDGKLDYITFPAAYGTGRTNSAGANSLVPQGLRLTQGLGEVGAFYLPSHQFSTDDGLVIEFEYIMDGSDALTDGITMFLVDANHSSSLQMGAAGAGFGYTHSKAFPLHSSKAILGISGAYLAVALDQGPFKTYRMEGDEMRNGIVHHNTPGYSTGSLLAKYDTRSNVTIRGAAGYQTRTVATSATTYTLQARDWGYPVLATRHTGWSADNGLSDPSYMRNDAGFVLNPSNGLFVKQVTPAIPQAFNIAGGGTSVGYGESGYRKMIIVLEPNPNTTEGGFKISVSIQHGTTITPVIDGFTYPATLTYIENGLARDWSSGLAQLPGSPPTVSMTVARPGNLVIGFAASTGIKTAYTNIIKNLRITPIHAANTANDDIRDHRRGPVTIRPFDNDLGYKEEGGSVIGSKEYLDPDSFRFWTDEYTCLNDTYTHVVAGKGKWVYDPTVSEVLFFPVKGFVGKVEIMYDVKGSFPPFDEEKYRSSLATISVTIADNQPVR